MTNVVTWKMFGSSSRYAFMFVPTSSTLYLFVDVAGFGVNEPICAFVEVV